MTDRSGLRTLAAAFLVVAVLGSCGTGEDETDTAVAQQVDVEAFDYYFSETQFLFDLGAEVTVGFTNSGGTTHSFTAEALDIDVEAASGESTEITFQVPNEPGVFDFYCKYHPDEMKGTVSIGGSHDPINEDPEGDVDDDDAEIEVEVEEDAGGGVDDNY